MTRALKILAFAAVALVWVQTAAAWHDAEHTLHGHEDTDIACEILSGTADQPVHSVTESDISLFVSKQDRLTPVAQAVFLRTNFPYLSRGPPGI